MRHLREMEEDQASSEDGIDLNLEYADYRRVPIEEAIEGVEEEAQLLIDIAEAGWDTDEAEAVVEGNMEAMGLTAPLDPGVAGLVLAISALGGTPISSCNGGLIGASSHRSEVPHILFTAPPDVMDRIIPAAIASEVGLIFNEGYAEAFADHLPNFHRLARSLLDLP
ncbi:hypothetical protein [Mesorhizobium sp. LSJC264A00]|uniref:hypothetical protein n=1 Tax=unclassified Mesorhizobium TaxID=325217 RepID=UPI0003CE976F|nr:hypothetical protein [Mesorhizobium sp. LSJC264A00]ESX24735.1 hypothetical protein X767_11525 [Mesorhizobium sp. LSJC264A00]